jgi:hypothetical protein
MADEKDNILQLVPQINKHYKTEWQTNQQWMSFGVHDSYTFSVDTQMIPHPCILLNLHY